MGWCSATEIFDDIVGPLLELHDSGKRPDTQAIITRLANALANGDWDCEGDSAYFDHPLVQKAYAEVWPRWYGNESEKD